MLWIKVLGPGCANCERVEIHAQEAVKLLRKSHPDLDAIVEKVTDVETFHRYGLLNTPGLVVNERLVSSGKIPTPDQMLGWLEEALEN